jgi:hypothetical protein
VSCCCGSGEKEFDLDWFVDVGERERCRDGGVAAGDGVECAGDCERVLDPELDADRDLGTDSEGARDTDCDREKPLRYCAFVGLWLRPPPRCDTRLGGCRKSSGSLARMSGELDRGDGVSPVLRRL